MDICVVSLDRVIYITPKSQLQYITTLSVSSTKGSTTAPVVRHAYILVNTAPSNMNTAPSNNIYNLQIKKPAYMHAQFSFFHATIWIQYYCWYFKLLTLEAEFRLELKVGHASAGSFITRHQFSVKYLPTTAPHCNSLAGCPTNHTPVVRHAYILVKIYRPSGLN